LLLADAQVVSHGEQEQFWIEEAKALLQGIILHVATASAEEGQRHLGRVRDLLLLDGEDMPQLFQRMTESEHLVVASTGARCLQKEEKLLANVIASAQAQTHFLDSLRIRESLSASDFRFEDLKREKMTIYLVLPADRLNAFGRWLRLLIQQAITVNARNIAEKPEKPVLFLLDEMPALGRLTMVEQAYGLMAGYGIQLWGIVQDLTQLKRIYGESWETFIGNSGVVQYFGSRDRTTAEYFSALCGVKTVWTLSSAISRSFSSGNGSSSSSTSTSETTSATQRKLAFPDELMRLPSDKQLVLIENLRPISAHKVAWFDDPAIQHLGQNLQPKRTA
jgi:type IV secretion system protein VirD4